MAKAKNPYLVQIVKDCQDDISLLPSQLQINWQKYPKILALDPYQTLGIPSHNLTKIMVVTCKIWSHCSRKID